MLKQQILRMTTIDKSLRADVDGWDGEDGHLIKQEKPIGLSAGLSFFCYPTPMHAIGDGWRLMGPPQIVIDYDIHNQPIRTCWEWWLEKLSEA